VQQGALLVGVESLGRGVDMGLDYTVENKGSIHKQSKAYKVKSVEQNQRVWLVIFHEGLEQSMCTNALAIINHGGQ
jgi:hypothetical protein